MPNFKKQSTKETKKGKPLLKDRFLFSKKNYLILIIGFITLIIGFLLLSGGGADGYDYSEEIFSTRRRIIAPIVIIISLFFCFFSIMIKK